MGITAILDTGGDIGASVRSSPSINAEMSSSSGFASLRTLSDVDASDMTDGNIVVYNLSLDTFITRNDPYKLTIDCGTF